MDNSIENSLDNEIYYDTRDGNNNENKSSLIKESYVSYIGTLRDALTYENGVIHCELLDSVLQTGPIRQIIEQPLFCTLMDILDWYIETKPETSGIPTEQNQLLIRNKLDEKRLDLEELTETVLMIDFLAIACLQKVFEETLLDEIVQYMRSDPCVCDGIWDRLTVEIGQRMQKMLLHFGLLEKKLKKAPDHQSYCHDLRFSPTGRYIITCNSMSQSSGTTSNKLEVRNHKGLLLYEIADGVLLDLDDRYLCLRENKTKIIFRDIETGMIISQIDATDIQELKLYDEYCVIFRKNAPPIGHVYNLGKLLIAGDGAETLACCTYVRFTPNRKCGAFVNGDNLEVKRLEDTLFSLSDVHVFLALDDKHLFYLDNNLNLVVRYLPTGVLLAEISQPEFTQITHVIPCDEHMILIYQDNTVLVYDLADLKQAPLAFSLDPQLEITSCAFSKKHNKLAIVSHFSQSANNIFVNDLNKQNEQLRLYDITTKTLVTQRVITKNSETGISATAIFDTIAFDGHELIIRYNNRCCDRGGKFISNRYSPNNLEFTQHTLHDILSGEGPLKLFRNWFKNSFLFHLKIDGEENIECDVLYESLQQPVATLGMNGDVIIIAGHDTNGIFTQYFYDLTTLTLKEALELTYSKS